MTKRGLTLALPLVVFSCSLLALSACASPAPIEVKLSSACLGDLRTAAKLAQTDVGQQPEPGDVELHQAATDCRTVLEFEGALAYYPSAMGYSNATQLDPSTDMSSLCGTMPAAAANIAPLCADAKKNGYLK